MRPSSFSYLQLALGFSMLEVLISIVLLSLGMLAAIGLQATALQAHQASRLHSAGVRLANELAELIHSNPASHHHSHSHPYLLDVNAHALPAAGTPCGTPHLAACTTPEAIAQRDIHDWLQRLGDVEHGGLPDFRAVVCFDQTPYDSTHGLAQWRCSHSGDTLTIKLGWRVPGSTTSPAADNDRPFVITSLIQGSD